MEQRTATRDQVLFDKIDATNKALELLAHRLKEINGTLSRIDFKVTEGDKLVAFDTASEILKNKQEKPTPLEVVLEVVDDT